MLRGLIFKSFNFMLHQVCPKGVVTSHFDFKLSPWMLYILGVSPSKSHQNSTKHLRVMKTNPSETKLPFPHSRCQNFVNTTNMFRTQWKMCDISPLFKNRIRNLKCHSPEVTYLWCVSWLNRFLMTSVVSVWK